MEESSNPAELKQLFDELFHQNNINLWKLVIKQRTKTASQTRRGFASSFLLYCCEWRTFILLIIVVTPK